MSFGEKLYQTRKAQGLSQEQLAELCSITRQSVSKWESGQGYPETENLLVLCRALNVDLDYLLRDEVDSVNPTAPKVSLLYGEYIGKWVAVMLKDTEMPGLSPLAVIDTNAQFVLVEQHKKRGLLKVSDILSITDAKLTAKQKKEPIPLMVSELQNLYNPYLLFENKYCHIRLRRGEWSRGLFGVYHGGYYDAKVVAVTENTLLIDELEKKQITVNTADILFIVER